MGEEREDTGELKGSNLKRMPMGQGALPLDPQARGLSMPAFQACALPLESGTEA